MSSGRVVLGSAVVVLVVIRGATPAPAAPLQVRGFSQLVALPDGWTTGADDEGYTYVQSADGGLRIELGDGTLGGGPPCVMTNAQWATWAGLAAAPAPDAGAGISPLVVGHWEDQTVEGTRADGAHVAVVCIQVPAGGAWAARITATGGMAIESAVPALAALSAALYGEQPSTGAIDLPELSLHLEDMAGWTLVGQRPRSPTMTGLLQSNDLTFELDARTTDCEANSFDAHSNPVKNGWVVLPPLSYAVARSYASFACLGVDGEALVAELHSPRPLGADEIAAFERTLASIAEQVRAAQGRRKVTLLLSASVDVPGGIWGVHSGEDASKVWLLSPAAAFDIEIVPATEFTQDAEGGYRTRSNVCDRPSQPPSVTFSAPRGWSEVVGKQGSMGRAFIFCTVRDGQAVGMDVYTYENIHHDAAAADRAIAAVLSGLRLPGLLGFETPKTPFTLRSSFLTSLYVTSPDTGSDSIGDELRARIYHRLAGGARAATGVNLLLDGGWGSGGGVAAARAGWFGAVSMHSTGLVVDVDGGYRARGISGDSDHFKMSGADVEAAAALIHTGGMWLLGVRGTVGDVRGAGAWTRVDVGLGLAAHPYGYLAFEGWWERDPGATTLAGAVSIGF